MLTPELLSKPCKKCGGLDFRINFKAGWRVCRTCDSVRCRRYYARTRKQISERRKFRKLVKLAAEH